MIRLKTPEEIAVIREGGRILADILYKVSAKVKPGVGTEELEDFACALIELAGGRPAFKNYQMMKNIYFPSALCISINEEVVHGSAIPNRILQNGDIVDIDVGMEYPVHGKALAENDISRVLKNIPRNRFSKMGGYYTDISVTLPVGHISKEAKKLIRVTRHCLQLAIEQVKPGNTINDIGGAVQDYAEKYGYGVVRDLVGHGVGHKVHEDPQIPHYRTREDSIRLEPGMVIAIEPMINAGTADVVSGEGFVICTADGKLSAHFEHTIAVTKTGCEVLTVM